MVCSWLSVVAQNQFSGLCLGPLTLFCSEEDLQQLLAVVPGGLMGEQTVSNKLIPSLGFSENLEFWVLQLYESLVAKGQ